MKNYIILLLLITFASCSSFDRMKYRHLKKVPATPQEFSEVEKMFTSTADTIAPQKMPAIDSIVISGDAGVCGGSELIETPIQLTGIQAEETFSPKEKVPSALPGAPIKRDWSLLIGAFLIVGGLLLLTLCIFYFPASGISFLWMIAFELASLYAAWRMIGTGVVYFITRFRSKRNFSER